MEAAVADDFRVRMLELRERVTREQGKRAGLWIAPPLWRLAWRLGFHWRPPIYMESWKVGLGMGIYFGPTCVLLIRVLDRVFAWIEGTPVPATPWGKHIFMAAFCGVFFGVWMAVVYAWHRRRWSGPTWEDVMGVRGFAVDYGTAASSSR